jgi:cephalosporin-C deacetylase-like acetyl esterase
MMRSFLALLLLGGLTLPAQGQQRFSSASQRYEMFQASLRERADEISRNSLTGLSDPAAWPARKAALRHEMLTMLGLDPLPERTPLHAQVTGQFEREDYTVRKVLFQSMPGLYVTGNLYVPKHVTGRLPAVLYLCGHAPGLWGAKVNYQHHGIALARRGFVAFLIDTIEFGEISGIHHGLHNLGMWNWLSLGYTPVGPEVWNAMRAMDYLETLPEVDPKRVALTGISGGGSITWYAAAADPRFSVVAPVCATWTAGDQLAEKSVVENCDCMYFPNTFQLDFPVLGALIAPRPLKAIGAKRDVMFPPAGYHAVYRKVRPVYEMLGAAGKLEEFDYETEHKDILPFRKEANEWIGRWLKDDSTPFEEGEIHREDGATLAVLDRVPADAINDDIQNVFIKTHRLRPYSSLPAWERRKRDLTEDLKKNVFRAFPSKTVSFDAAKKEFHGWTERYANSWDLEFTTESNVRVTAQLFVPRPPAKPTEALIYVKGAEDIVDPIDYDQILPAIGKQVVLVLKPRAVDYPVSNEGMTTLKRSAAILGATIESMQVWDILRSVDYLVSAEGLNLTSISIYGRKDMGVLGIYAAIFDKRITRVILDNPPASHWQSPALLNVLRFTDLPEAAALMAPRELVSLTPLPEPYAFTRTIYGLFGKSESFHQAGGLTRALRLTGR